MTRRALSLTASIDLLIARAIAAGLTVEAVEITVDGSLRILTRRPAVRGLAVNENESWVDLAGQAQDLGRA